MPRKKAEKKQMESKFMKTAEVAEYIGVSARTVVRWTTDGKFPPCVKLSPRIFRWKKEDVDQWMFDNYDC